MAGRCQAFVVVESLQEALRAAVYSTFAESIEASTRFFQAQAERMALTCLAMAQRFHGGGRLLVFGNGGLTTDAQHISVEFVHPVMVGKRALPAISLTNDIAVVTGIARDGSFEDIFAQQLQVLGAKGDIALGLSPDGNCINVLRALEMAQAMECLTIGVAGENGGKMAQATGIDACFVIPSAHPLVVQEVHETLYHILWEQVQLFFEHKELLDGRAGLREQPQEADQFSDLFYPFLHAPAQVPLETVLTEVRQSTLEKSCEVAALRQQVCQTSTEALVCAAAAMANAFGHGKKLLTFGNGGSATDAQRLSVDFVHPPLANRKALPAMSLTNDIAVVTALANDVGFANVFARQLMAFGKPGDMAVGISTSGNSHNLLVAFETAKRLGLLTLGLAGYDGGQMARAETVDYCFVVPSSSVHRIQEVQASIFHILWDLVHRLLETWA